MIRLSQGYNNVLESYKGTCNTNSNKSFHGGQGQEMVRVLAGDCFLILYLSFLVNKLEVYI